MTTKSAQSLDSCPNSSALSTSLTSTHIHAHKIYRTRTCRTAGYEAWKYLSDPSHVTGACAYIQNNNRSRVCAAESEQRVYRWFTTNSRTSYVHAHTHKTTIAHVFARQNLKREVQMIYHQSMHIISICAYTQNKNRSRVCAAESEERVYRWFTTNSRTSYLYAHTHKTTIAHVFARQNLKREVQMIYYKFSHIICTCAYTQNNNLSRVARQNLRNPRS